MPRKPRSFYASDEEWEQIGTDAKQANKGRSTYIRETLLEDD